MIVKSAMAVFALVVVAPALAQTPPAPRGCAVRSKVDDAN